MGTQEKPKLNYRRTLLIGLGFFASSLLWSIYNSFVPLILRDFVSSTATVGLIMTIDNVFGVILQPYFGARSDQTRTRFGRRMPYVLFGAPICAALFILIPWMKALWMLMAVVILFNFIMSIWRAPMIALMPDLTPDPLRSQANGLINLMGGLAAITAFLLGGQIAHSYGRGAVFLMGSLVMISAVVILYFTIKENQLNPRLLAGDQLASDQLASDQLAASEAGVRRPFGLGLAGFNKLPIAARRSLVFLLLAIFFWFAALNAVETFFTSYATLELNQSEGQAAMLMAAFSLAFVAFALPSGIIADKLGRRRTILMGLLGLILVFVLLYFAKDLWTIRFLLGAGGFFWALVNINALPMVLAMAGDHELGTFIGHYYFFSFSANIASPILYGLLRDVTGNFRSLFIYAPIAVALAFLAILQVTHFDRGEHQGEADGSESIP